MRRFRFGYQLPADVSVGGLRARAVRAESAGFDVIHTSDHVSGGWPPITPLLSVSDVTAHVRVCPLVVNNDFRHPVQLARDVAAVDHLSGGRVELGIGAGHAFDEYRALGLPFDDATVRKDRMAEAVELLRLLLTGEEVTYGGAFYRVEGVRTMASLQQPMPILVGVGGSRALAHAARHADIVGLTMLGRTLEDGRRHAVRWEAGRLDQTVAHLRAHAAERWERLELHALVQSVVVTNDRRGAATRLADQVEGLTVDSALSTPFLALGTHGQIAEHLQECRRRWNISYFSVRELDVFAPVIERMAAGL